MRPYLHRKMDAIHGFAREGDVANMLKCIENGVSVNLKGELFTGFCFYKFIYYSQMCCKLSMILSFGF